MKGRKKKKARSFTFSLVELHVEHFNAHFIQDCIKKDGIKKNFHSVGKKKIEVFLLFFAVRAFERWKKKIPAEEPNVARPVDFLLQCSAVT